jgi:hypothetical protein
MQRPPNTSCIREPAAKCAAGVPHGKACYVAELKYVCLVSANAKGISLNPKSRPLTWRRHIFESSSHGLDGRREILIHNT